MSKLPADDRVLLCQIVEESYQLPTWNETNLRSSISRVNVEVAGWVPPKAKRNIAEIVVHCAYWKYALRRRIRGDRRGTFAMKGSNWFPLDRPLAKQRWNECRALLDEEHQALVNAITGYAKKLNYSGRSEVSRDLTRRIFGLAIHDAYHTGQINMIKAMYRRQKK